MANIFELSSNQKTFDELQNIKNKLQQESDKLQQESDRKEQEMRDAMVKSHKEVHIFSNHDEALDYLESHPGEWIHWHGWELKFDSNDQKFKSIEDHSDYDGINWWTERHTYSREDLLQDVEDLFKRNEMKYPEIKGTKYWLDEYGKLESVYIYKNESWKI